MNKGFFKKALQVVGLFTIVFCCISCGGKKLKFEEILRNEENGITTVASTDKPLLEQLLTKLILLN